MLPSFIHEGGDPQSLGLQFGRGPGPHVLSFKHVKTVTVPTMSKPGSHEYVYCASNNVELSAENRLPFSIDGGRPHECGMHRVESPRSNKCLSNLNNHVMLLPAFIYNLIVVLHIL